MLIFGDNSSLGYAYVNFHNVNDADRALNAINYRPLHNREIRLMWSQRDPALRKSGVGNIFIKNLDTEIDNKALHDTFATFGNILSCKVMTDEKGESRGFGFVHFESNEAADKAIEQLNGKLFNDKPVYVGRHVSKRERESKFEEMKKNFTNVYVKFIDPAVTDEEFLALFTKFGQITSHVIARDENGTSKGFGFVNFASHEDAVRASDELNNQEFHGKKLYVGRAQKKSERHAEIVRRRNERYSKFQDVNIYIKNIDDTIDDDQLRQEFAPFGTITSAKVITDDKGASRGFGFVCFAEPDEATKAIAAMNNKIVGTKPLYVALAMRKEYRRQFLENQHQQRMLMHQQINAAGMYNPGFYPPMNMAARPNQFYPNMYAQQRPRFAQQGNAPGMPAGNRPFAPFGAMPNPRMPRQARGPPRMMNPMGGPAGARPPTGPMNGVPKAFPATTFTAEELNNGDAKNKLGNYIFSKASAMFGPQAPQLTGMLLQLGNEELVQLQNSASDLEVKLREAFEAVNAQAQEQPAPQAQQPAAVQA